MAEDNYMGFGQTFRPEEISAMSRTKRKEVAESHFGIKVSDAVVIVQRLPQ